MKSLPLLTVATLIAAPTFAEDTRHAESHEHGVGQLNIAFDGAQISMELHAPGADIVGFEYEAKNEEDHAAIDTAISTLTDPMNLFNFPTEANCSMLEATAELEGEGKHDDHKEDDDHDKHGSKEESHTEFHAEYLFECKNVDAVKTISFPYFEAFPNAKELELQVITSKGASAFEVENDAPSVGLSSLF